MRKFKNQFAAIVAAAMTGVMTLGLAATAAPVATMYAAENDFIVKADKTEVPVGTATTITLSAGIEDSNGEIATPDNSATFEIDGSYTGASISGSTLTITAEAAAGNVTVKATGSGDNAAKTAIVTITIQDATTDNPSDGAATTIEIDYTNYIAKITGDTSAKYAFLEVWKFGDKDATDFDETTGSKDKLSTTYSYELTGGKVTVDLSFLKATTAQGIKIYTDKNTKKNEKVKKVIAAQPGKLSGLKYNSATGEFDISKAKEGKTSLTTLDKTLYEYRGQYAADWEPLEDLAAVNHISAGSTIVIRKEATETTPAGPEAKVKIAAAAKAPKITIDYKKGTVKFSDKMQYGANGVAWQDGLKDAMTLADLRKNLGNAPATQELVVFAYTKGDASKGKPNSNVASVIIPADVELTDTNGVITAAGDSVSKVEHKTSTSGSGKSAKEIYEFKVTGAAYEFSTVAPGADRKWKSVADGKSYTVVLGNAESVVYVRRAGVKAKTADDSRFPSAEVTVTIPAASGDNEGGSEQPKPVTVNESVSNLQAWEENVTYYSDADCETAVDKSQVTTPVTGTTYYVKATYTPVTVKAPEDGTTYYTTTDGKVFTEATLGEDGFVSGTTYYTRTVE
ncbi:MAG: hypothetical protein K2O03_01110 [Lachnospiraceae bacterium]|nr:hypothetical protein [Lachnospiraceae bacterium]